MSTLTAQRSSASADPVRVRYNRFGLDEANATLLRDGEAIAVAPTPFAVLCALARQPASLHLARRDLDVLFGPLADDVARANECYARACRESSVKRRD